MSDKAKVPCPVCAKKFKPDGLILHFRKAAVFEVYDFFKVGGFIETFEETCPHEVYIRKNSQNQQVFKI